MNSLFFLLFLTESENEEELDWNTHVALIIIAKQKMKNGMEIIEIEKNYFLGHTERLGGIDMEYRKVFRINCSLTLNPST